MQLEELNYLKESVNKFYNFIYYKDLENDELKNRVCTFYVNKTLHLYQERFNKDEFNSKIFIACCFWIINKYCDDNYLYRKELKRVFNLTSSSNEAILDYEEIIIHRIDWNFEFLKL